MQTVRALEMNDVAASESHVVHLQGADGLHLHQSNPQDRRDVRKPGNNFRRLKFYASISIEDCAAVARSEKSLSVMTPSPVT